MRNGITEDGLWQPFDVFFLARASRPMEPVYGVVEPSFCVIVQGRKEVSLGDQRYQYDPYQFLLGFLEVPVVFRVMEASEEKPYLGLRLNISTDPVISVMAELEQLSAQPMRSRSAGWIYRCLTQSSAWCDWWKCPQMHRSCCQ